MSPDLDEPPDDNEAFESFDEALDEEDLPGHGGGPEGERELDRDLTVDETALHEIGADLDDPDRVLLFDGMDDPDGSGPPPAADADAGWGSDDDESEEFDEDASPDDVDADPELEIVDTDATDMDRVPEGAPGPDSARW